MFREEKHTENESLKSYFKIKEQDVSCLDDLVSDDPDLDINIDENDENPENRLFGNIESKFDETQPFVEE